MKKNMGTTDRVLRMLLAIVIGVLFFAHVISGITAIVMLILSGIFIVTSFISFCPLYFAYGITTNKPKA